MLALFLGGGWWWTQWGTWTGPEAGGTTDPAAGLMQPRDARLTIQLDAQGYQVDPELWLLKPILGEIEVIQREEARVRMQVPLEVKALEQRLEAARARVNVTQNMAADLKAQREVAKASLATNSTEKKAKLDAIWASSQKRIAAESEQRREDFVALVRQRANELKLVMPPVEREEPELVVSAMRMAVFTLPKPRQDTNVLVWADAAFADYAKRDEEAQADQDNIRKQVDATRAELDRIIEQDQLLVDTLLVRQQQAETDHINAKLELEQAEAALREKRSALERAPRELRQRMEQLIEGSKQLSLLSVAENVWQKIDLGSRPDLMGDRVVCLRARRMGTNYFGLIPVTLHLTSHVRTNATEEIFRSIEDLLAPKVPAQPVP